MNTHNTGAKAMEDYTQAEYEVALREAGFTRGMAVTRYHVVTQLADGTSANFNEAALFDMFATRREVLAELVASRHWENTQLNDSTGEAE